MGCCPHEILASTVGSLEICNSMPSALFSIVIFYDFLSAESLSHMSQFHKVILFQRMDLGECAKVHEYALRADFERSQKDKDYFYDVDVSQVYMGNHNHIQCYILLWLEMTCRRFNTVPCFTTSGMRAPQDLHRRLRPAHGAGQEAAAGDAGGALRRGHLQG